MLAFRSLLGVAAALVSAGCGGGGGSSKPVTVVIASTPELDGAVGSTGGFSTAGTVIQPGDGTTNVGNRAFLSFDLGVIPAGAEVTEATLTVTQSGVTGSPFATLGVVVADQVVYGNTLESGAYDRSYPANQAFAVLSANATLGAKTVLATAVVQDDLANGHGKSQYRLRFDVLETDNDNAFDFVDFVSGELSNPEAQRPKLVVTYVP